MFTLKSKRSSIFYPLFSNLYLLSSAVFVTMLQKKLFSFDKYEKIFEKSVKAIAYIW